MTEGASWLWQFAADRGFRYEPDVDDRWLRLWEPFATLKTPARYEHALYSTGTLRSLTIARFVVSLGATEASAWVAIAQDERLLDATAAATSDAARVFTDEVVQLPRQVTQDKDFGRAFASYAPTEEQLRLAFTPSLRKLLLGWRAPVHVELRKGGFILLPVALGFDARALAWLVQAVYLLGEKAAKRESSSRA